MPITMSSLMEQSDGKPGHNWGISFVIIHPVDLFPTMQIEASLVFLDLVRSDVSLAPHGPDCRDNVCIFRDFRPLD